MDCFHYLANNAIPTWEKRTINEREYLVGPASLIVPGVLNGSKGALFYPPDEIIKTVDSWNHIPITNGHPTNPDGSPASARRPEILDRFGIGNVFAANYEGRLEAEAWIDVLACKRNAPQILNMIQAGKPVELSTGLYTDDQEAPAGSVYNGRSGQKPFDYIARNYRPDHLAILTDQKGACSLADGCGLGVNGSNPIKALQACGEWLKNHGGAMPGYGQIYLKENGSGEVWYVGGDGDEQGFDKVVKQKLMEVDGIDEVRYESEYSPKEPGWIQVYPSKKDQTDTSDISSNVLVKAWELLVNAFKPNQPRSQVTGRIKKLNAGVGKGPAHEAAQDGFFGGICKECGGVKVNGECPACKTAALNPPEIEVDLETNELLGTGMQDSPLTAAPVESVPSIGQLPEVSMNEEGDEEEVEEEDPEEQALLAAELIDALGFDIDAILATPPTENGGPGSGNFGHEGRPGEVGGSTSGSGGGGSSGESKPKSGAPKGITRGMRKQAALDAREFIKKSRESKMFELPGDTFHSDKFMDAFSKLSVPQLREIAKEEGVVFKGRLRSDKVKQLASRISDLHYARRSNEYHFPKKEGAWGKVKKGLSKAFEIAATLGIKDNAEREQVVKYLLTNGFTGVDVTYSGDRDMNRDQTINFLVTNCDCWKGKEQVLRNAQAFSDEDLKKLARNFELTRGAGLVVNALKKKFGDAVPKTLNEMPAFIQEKIDAKKEDGEETENEGDENVTEKKEDPMGALGVGDSPEEVAKNKRKGKMAGNQRRLTMAEFQAIAPVELLERDQMAQRVLNKEKKIVINKLTGHLPEAKRNARATKLSALSLDELYDRLADMPRVTNEDAAPAEEEKEKVPVFGSGKFMEDEEESEGATTNANDIEILDLPTMNAEVWAGKRSSYSTV